MRPRSHEPGAHGELLDLAIDLAVAIEAIAVEAAVAAPRAAPLERHAAAPDRPHREVARSEGREKPELLDHGGLARRYEPVAAHGPYRKRVGAARLDLHLQRAPDRLADNRPVPVHAEAALSG